MPGLISCPQLSVVLILLILVRMINLLMFTLQRQQIIEMEICYSFS